LFLELVGDGDDVGVGPEVLLEASEDVLGRVGKDSDESHYSDNIVYFGKHLA
jgi:hypothetical protein